MRLPTAMLSWQLAEYASGWLGGGGDGLGKLGGGVGGDGGEVGRGPHGGRAGGGTGGLSGGGGGVRGICFSLHESVSRPTCPNTLTASGKAMAMASLRLEVSASEARTVSMVAPNAPDAAGTLTCTSPRTVSHRIAEKAASAPNLELSALVAKRNCALKSTDSAPCDIEQRMACEQQSRQGERSVHGERVRYDCGGQHRAHLCDQRRGLSGD